MDDDGTGVDTADRSLRRRISTRWLLAAIITTVIVLAAVWIAADGLLESLADPAGDSSETVFADTDSLTVVVSRTPGGSSEWANFARVIGEVSKVIDMPVAVRYMTTEDEANEVIATEGTDVALICAHSYLDLLESGIVEGLVVPVLHGTPETVMRLVVRSDDPAMTFEDLEGLRIGVSTRSSLGGQAYLLWLCEQKGVDVQEFFSEVLTGKTMEENLHDMFTGSIDVTVVNSAQLSEVDAARLKTIEESPPFGAPPVAVSSSLDPETVALLRDAFLGLDLGELLSVDAVLEGFVPIEDVDYGFQEELRHICDQHGHL